MIVQVSDFTGIIALGVNTGTGASSTTLAADTAWLESLINVYEREYYDKLLGEDFAEGWWEWLGTAVEDREANAAYEALLALLGNETPNPAACYVYFKVLDNANMRMSATGAHRTADEGSVNPRGLAIRAWNIMVRENRRIVKLIEEDTTGTWDDADICPHFGMLETLNWYGI